MGRSRRRGPPIDERIRTGAEALFTERGFGSVSLRDVLAASKVSTTAFYARYPSKEAVLEALVDDLLASLGQRAEAVVSSAKTLDEGYRLGIDALIQVLAARQGLVRVALSEGLAVPEAGRRIGQALDALVAVLAAGLAQQGDDDAAARASALVGALTFDVMRWAVLGQLDEAELALALGRTANVLRPPG